MVEWKEYRIKDLGEVVTGNTPPTSNREYYGTEYKFIKPTDMVEGQRFVSTTEEYYSELAYQKYKKCLLPPKTPCVVTIGSLGKKMCLTDTECFTNQAVNAVIPNKENDGEFLYYAFKASVLAYVKQLDSGTTSGRENVSKSSFSKIKVRVPPLPTQQKIASILSAYDNLIQNYKKQIETLQTAASELYKEWFVRFRFPGWQNANFENGIPEGWKYLKLSEFGYEVESGNRPAGGIDDSLKDGIPSLGAESIDKLGYFDYSNVKLVPREFYDKMKRGHGKDNDILLYKDGAYIGKVTLFRNGFPFREYTVNEHVFLLRSNNKDYQNYLYFTLNMPQYFTQMQNLNRNAAQPGLARGDLDRIKILVPNEKVIEKFNKLINPMIDNIFSYSKQITNLTQQRDLLLPRLMSGKLEVLK